MVSVVGILLFTVDIFQIIQCVFIHIPMAYLQYAPSLFASKDFMRSPLASGAVLFSHPLFTNLGVAPDVSLIGENSILRFGVKSLLTLGTISHTLRIH